MKLKEGHNQDTISHNIKVLEGAGRKPDQALIMALNEAAKSNRDISYKGRAFFGSRLSENITKTPEGYLICQNVPIARTGIQEYLGQELGLEGEHYDRIIEVHRKEGEVFAAEALASFEGKPVTNEHPGSEVRSDNHAHYARGHVQNIRRGKGETQNNVVADLVVYDPTLINEIENGKREVSCGYDCVYIVGEDGVVYQTKIRGNHVAIVRSGRAGSEVSIKDAKPKPERREERVSEHKDNKSIWARMLKAFAASDATPEDIEDVLETYSQSSTPRQDDSKPATDGGDTMDKEKKTTTDEKLEGEAKGTNPQVDNALGQVLAAIEAMKADIAELKVATKPKEADALAELEKELGGEEGVTEAAEEIDEETVDQDGPVAPTSSLPENPIPGADNKEVVLGAIRAMKPVIAQIKDDKQRKQVSDALAQSLRSQLGTGQGQKGSYAAILDAKTKSAHKRADDAAPEEVDISELGREIAKSRNPHYKGK